MSNTQLDRQIYHTLTIVTFLSKCHFCVDSCVQQTETKLVILRKRDLVTITVKFQFLFGGGI